MNHKILSGTVDGKYFVAAIFDNEKAVRPLEIGLQRFFEKYESSTLESKRKKELDHGYFTLSDTGNSSG